MKDFEARIACCRLSFVGDTALVGRPPGPDLLWLDSAGQTSTALVIEQLCTEPHDQMTRSTGYVENGCRNGCATRTLSESVPVNSVNSRSWGADQVRIVAVRYSIRTYIDLVRILSERKGETE